MIAKMEQLLKVLMLGRHIIKTDCYHLVTPLNTFHFVKLKSYRYLQIPS